VIWLRRCNSSGRRRWEDGGHDTGRNETGPRSLFSGAVDWPHSAPLDLPQFNIADAGGAPIVGITRRIQAGTSEHKEFTDRYQIWRTSWGPAPGSAPAGKSTTMTSTMTSWEYNGFKRVNLTDRRFATGHEGLFIRYCMTNIFEPVEG
jgi:hypothetical protein